MVICRRAGVVDLVDSQRIIVRVGAEGREDFGADIYTLIKFKRSNQNTCMNQRPIVREGQRVEAGPGAGRRARAPSDGELALGRNVLVAFMPWRGYNFEDAILVSEKLVKEDSYTSIHIEEFEIEARDTKLGPEEITRDIPNVSEEFLKDLDEAGRDPHRRPRQAGRHPGRQGDAQGRDPADARGEAAAGDLRREVRRRARRLADHAARASRASSSTSRSSAARASRRTSARWRSSRRRSSGCARTWPTRSASSARRTARS